MKQQNIQENHIKEQITDRINDPQREERRQHWFVIRELTGRELKRRYSRSKLGVAWSILNPLLTMAVLSMVFSRMFSRSIENFPIYYLCGYVIWLLFVGATNSAMTALVDNRMMLIKVKMPMDVFLLSRAYTAFVNFLYSLIAFVAMLAVFRVIPSWRIIVFPIIVVFLSLFSLGLSYVLSCAYVFFGDIKHLWGVVTTLWMYLSAIFYPADMLSGFMQTVLQWNPIFIYIDSLRHIILWNSMPTTAEFIKMIVFGIFSFEIGKYIFNSNRNKIMQKL